MEWRVTELDAACCLAGREFGGDWDREARDAAAQLREACLNLLIWEDAVRLGKIAAEEATEDRGGPYVAASNQLNGPYDRVDRLARMFEQLGAAPDNTEEEIMARARAVHTRKVQEYERQRQDAAQRLERDRLIGEYGRSVTSLFEAADPLDGLKDFDPSRFLPQVFTSLTAAGQTLRAQGFDAEWLRVDRQKTFDHYWQSFGDREEARVVFDWGFRLMDKLFANELRQDHIDRAWNESELADSADSSEGRHWPTTRGMAGRS